MFFLQKVCDVCRALERTCVVALRIAHPLLKAEGANELAKSLAIVSTVAIEGVVVVGRIIPIHTCRKSVRLIETVLVAEAAQPTG